MGYKTDHAREIDTDADGFSERGAVFGECGNIDIEDRDFRTAYSWRQKTMRAKLRG